MDPIQIGIEIAKLAVTIVGAVFVAWWLFRLLTVFWVSLFVFILTGPGWNPRPGLNL